MGFNMRTSFLLLAILLAPSLSFSMPAITSLTGLAMDGEIMEIEGAAFGPNGPKIVLFDDFSGGVDGQQAASSAVIGTWASMRGFIFQDKVLSRGKGLRVVDPSFSSGHTVNWIEFGAPYSEVFMTSRAYVPEGYKFPSSSDLKTMPTISGLKHHWPMYGPKGYTDTSLPDVFGPNWTGKNYYSVASNDSPISSYDTSGHVQWVWDEPVRWLMWIKGNGLSIEGSDGLFQAVSSSGQTHRRYQNYKAWFTPNHSVYAFDRMTVVGYLRSGSVYPEHNYIIDDVYVAVGPNSAARIEIGNKPLYTECTKMAVSTPVSWSANKISFTLREGTFKIGEPAFLFVVDANNTPSEGYPIEFGVKYPLPLPPNNLTILN